MLVLWGAHGVVGRLFDPLATWRVKCDATVMGRAFETGHFIPEEAPDQVLDALEPFLIG